MALNFPFPHEYPVGQDVFSALNIPLKSINGLHYVGITSLTLLIISLYFLGRSLKMYHNRMVLIAILLAFFLPLELVSAYQKTLASGINAVHYDRENSHCTFEMKNDTTLSASCDLPFENYNNGPVQFNIKFYEKYLFEGETPLLSLMNEGGPYNVILNGKEREIVTIETEIDLSQLEVESMSGEAWEVNVMIKDKGKVRKL
ncbi:hypothetical protein J7E32_03655 [Bacillus sp. ISL-55]|nr:hypothetical protein [Bacillus sp. ISL-55]